MQRVSSDLRRCYSLWFHVTEKHSGWQEIVQPQQTNLETVINYLPSFVFGSDRVLTFKDKLFDHTKEYETSRLSFMSEQLERFKGVGLSQSSHQWSCSLIMCSSVWQTGDDRLRARDHSVFTDWTSLKRRRLHRTGITEPLPLFLPFTLSHLTNCCPNGRD